MSIENHLMKTTPGKWKHRSTNFLNSQHLVLSISFLSCRRWELFHGHNSEGAQWESQSTNPRQPNALSLEHVGHVSVEGATAKLSAASQAIADLEDEIQTELIRQRTTPTKPEPTSASSNSSLSSKPIMDSDPPTAPSAKLAEANAKPSTTPEAEKKIDLDLSAETVEHLCLAAYLLSPASSGLYDELLALVQAGALEISTNGIPRLSKDWVTKVDVVLLQDLDAAWGTHLDPEGRYGIHPGMRDCVEEAWTKTSDGCWALDDGDDVVYDESELEEWRQFFQGQRDEQANVSDGIGRFGL